MKAIIKPLVTHRTLHCLKLQGILQYWWPMSRGMALLALSAQPWQSEWTRRAAASPMARPLSSSTPLLLSLNFQFPACAPSPFPGSPAPAGLGTVICSLKAHSHCTTQSRQLTFSPQRLTDVVTPRHNRYPQILSHPKTQIHTETESHTKTHGQPKYSATQIHADPHTQSDT